MARGLVAGGLAMIPWLTGLAIVLPGTAVADHWAAAWTGLDCLEAAGLLATGMLALRRDPRRCLSAAVTATLLAVDAWLDVTTAAPGAGQMAALAMAAAELPAAAVCAAIALRAAPPRGAHTSTARHAPVGAPPR